MWSRSWGRATGESHKGEWGICCCLYGTSQLEEEAWQEVLVLALPPKKVTNMVALSWWILPRRVESGSLERHQVGVCADRAQRAEFRLFHKASKALATLDHTHGAIVNTQKERGRLSCIWIAARAFTLPLGQVGEEASTVKNQSREVKTDAQGKRRWMIIDWWWTTAASHTE